MPEFKEGYALVIGVGEYENSAWNVLMAVKDAEAVAGALVDQNVCAYPGDQVRLLLNEETTRDGVISAFKELQQRTTTDDTVLVYFCGHGALGDDGLYYLATHDVKFGNGRIYAGTGISAPDLINYLRDIPAKKLLLILNSCYSGHTHPAFAPEPGTPELITETANGFGSPASLNFKANVLSLGEGRAILTASQPTQKSYFYNVDPLSIFTQALVDGLHGKDLQTTSAYVGLFELYGYVWQQVQKVAEDKGLDQEPVLSLLQNAGPFPIAHFRGGTSGSMSLGSIQSQPSAGVPVDRVQESIAQAVGKGSRAVNAGGDVTYVEMAGIVVSSGGSIGTVNVGKIVIGNYYEKNAQAAGTDDPQELLKLIEQVREDVAKLSQSNAPAGDVEDAGDDLRKAKEAGEKGDSKRLLEKLESAQKVILSIATAVPAAVQIGQTVGTLLQRAMALWK